MGNQNSRAGRVANLDAWITRESMRLLREAAQARRTSIDVIVDECLSQVLKPRPAKDNDEADQLETA